MDGHQHTRIAILLMCGLSCCWESSHGTVDVVTPPDVLVDPAGADHALCLDPVCDVVPQCGCPDGAMCTMIEGLGRFCAAPGTGLDGAPCTMLECAPGYLCAGGLCRKACRDDADCPATGACYRYLGDGEHAVCNVRCSHLTNEGCPDGFRCDVRRPEYYDYPFHDCNRQEALGEYHDPCTLTGEFDPEVSPSKDCLPGHICVDSMYFGPRCYMLCGKSRTGPDPECPAEDPCCVNPWEEEIDEIPYGICSAQNPCEP